MKCQKFFDYSICLAKKYGVSYGIYMMILPHPLAFEWDRGNKAKNLNKHKVTDQECEEIFFDEDKKMYKDELHSSNEQRCVIIGKTKQERLLFVVFTIRKSKIRVISARDLNSREKALYEKTA